MPKETSIADRFERLIGGHRAFDDGGSILCPRNTVGHYAKVRHLKALAKGLPSIEADRDSDVDAHVPAQEWHVPFEQMIFVGDGDSDLPAFDLMKDRGGIAIAVHQAADETDWESTGDMRNGRQVMVLARSDFSPDSRLMQALCAAGRLVAWPPGGSASWSSVVRADGQATRHRSGRGGSAGPPPIVDVGSCYGATPRTGSREVPRVHQRVPRREPAGRLEGHRHPRR